MVEECGKFVESVNLTKHPIISFLKIIIAIIYAEMHSKI